jgi:hypothetical protein
MTAVLQCVLLNFNLIQQSSKYFLPILINVQRDATQSILFIILHVHSTCFLCQPHPSSGVNKNVNTASGTGHIFYAVAWPRLREITPPVPEDVVTVLCTSDDECG